MRVKYKRFRRSLLNMCLVLPLLFLTFCDEKGEDIIKPTSELTFTKYSEISTLLKMAVEAEDDEQCVHYDYPITFFAQLSSSSSIEAISINSDDELFSFFDQLSTSDEIRIDFPMNLIGVEGEITVINSLDELKDTLEVVINACSGSDDYDYCHSNNKKVYICHNGTTICVSVNAINAHLEHGDTLGKCNDDDDDDDDDDNDDDDSDD